MRAQTPLEKGQTILHIGSMKTEDTSWTERTVKHNIILIGNFLNNNIKERMTLAKWGAIRLTMEEAKEVIAEALRIDQHFMYSPRTNSDRASKISV
eukprot:238348-Heterocapsa_arctica.AAC.1